jgi:hypothetical protein
MPSKLKKTVIQYRSTIAIVLVCLLLLIAAQILPRLTANPLVHRIADIILWVFRRS